MAPRHPWSTGLVAVALLALVLGGCGISSDGEPREISRQQLPAELIDPDSTDTTLPLEDGSSNRVVTLYLVETDEAGTERLIGVRRAVPVPDDDDDVPAAVARALIAASPERLGRTDLVNALPPDAEVLSAEIDDDGVLLLDLSELGSVESALQRLAVAQLVFTLTEASPRIQAVRFTVDGEPVAVPVEDGVAAPGTPVRPSDDPSLQPDSAAIRPAD